MMLSYNHPPSPGSRASGGRRRHRDPETNRLVLMAVEQGWTHEILSTGHHRLVPPDRTKPMVVFAGSPSDRRNRANLISLLRRSGMDI